MYKVWLACDKMTKQNIKTFIIADDGTFPNNETLPLILMQRVFDPTSRNLVRTIEEKIHE